LIQDSQEAIHLTQNYYEKYLDAKYHNVNEGGDYGGLSFLQYRLFFDALQA
jgi:hypothetical protein